MRMQSLSAPTREQQSSFSTSGAAHQVWNCTGTPKRQRRSARAQTVGQTIVHNEAKRDKQFNA